MLSNTTSDGKVSTPRVTVGMPTYNRARLLAETIGYVLDQTYTDFELLIFDDGSTDGTAEVIRSFADPRIRFLGSRRCGPPQPLNELYGNARGEFVIILHDHDIFNPALLQKSVDALDRNPSAAFVLQGAASIAEDGVSSYRDLLEDRPELNSGWEAGSEMLRKVHSFGSTFHACSMVRRSALDRVGRHYRAEYGLHADVDLWLRLLRHLISATSGRSYFFSGSARPGTFLLVGTLKCSIACVSCSCITAWIIFKTIHLH